MFSLLELRDVLVDEVIPLLLFVWESIFTFSALLHELICEVLGRFDSLVVVVDDGGWVPFVGLLLGVELGHEDWVFGAFQKGAEPGSIFIL